VQELGGESSMWIQSWKIRKKKCDFPLILFVLVKISGFKHAYFAIFLQISLFETAYWELTCYHLPGSCISHKGIEMNGWYLKDLPTWSAVQDLPDQSFTALRHPKCLDGQRKRMKKTFINSCSIQLLCAM
jgi:hypothetical protein